MAVDLKTPLDPIHSKARPLESWLTTFHLVLVGLDPFKYESAWILEAAERILKSFSGADCRTAWLVAGTKENARDFLGPLSREILTFADPNKAAVKALGIQRLPAFIHINQAGEILGATEGWQPEQWREAVKQLADAMGWKAPIVPKPGDPAPFKGAPV